MIGENKASIKKIKKNILPPFEDEGWDIVNGTTDIFKNGYEVSFTSNGYQHGLVYYLPNSYAGKTLSISVEKMAGAQASVSLVWYTGSAWVWNIAELDSKKVENISIPVGVYNIRVLVVDRHSNKGKFYFKNIQLEEGLFATEFDEKYEASNNSKQTIIRYPEPKDNIKFWSAGADLTTGTSNPTAYRNTWNRDESALQLNSYTSSHHGHSFLLPVDEHLTYRISAKAKLSPNLASASMYDNVIFFDGNKARLSVNQNVDIVGTDTWNTTLDNVSYKDVEMSFKLKNIPSDAKYFTFQLNRNGSTSTDYVLLKDFR